MALLAKDAMEVAEVGGTAVVAMDAADATIDEGSLFQ